jgi:hypothetical protein
LAKQLASWVGACPGAEESAGVSYSRRAPKGNRQMRRLLTTAANATVKTKGSIFEYLYRRWVIRLGHRQTIGAIAHRLCRLIWKILHEGVSYEERGPAVTKERLRARTAKMIRELRASGTGWSRHDAHRCSTLVRGTAAARADELIHATGFRLRVAIASAQLARRPSISEADRHPEASFVFR